MMAAETIALKKQLVDALWRELTIARDRSTAAEREAQFTVDRINAILKALRDAGVIPTNGKGERHD